MTQELDTRPEAGGAPAQTPAQALVRVVQRDDFRGEIAKALPDGVSVDRFQRAAVTALLQSEAIAEADFGSICQSLIRCAQDGLLPDGREAALVVYNTKTKVDGRDVWTKKAQYLPMIFGLRRIAAEYGWTMDTRVVYEADEFDYELGMEPRIVHRPARPGGPLRQPRRPLA